MNERQGNETEQQLMLRVSLLKGVNDKMMAGPIFH